MDKVDKCTSPHGIDVHSPDSGVDNFVETVDRNTPGRMRTPCFLCKTSNRVGKRPHLQFLVYDDIISNGIVCPEMGGKPSFFYLRRN